ncbi:short chain dehydrogenase [Sesbania bispinosa]|nr:short chain dehydrogenase [Sesbania bispinosa]
MVGPLSNGGPIGSNGGSQWYASQLAMGDDIDGPIPLTHDGGNSVSYSGPKGNNAQRGTWTTSLNTITCPYYLLMKGFGDNAPSGLQTLHQLLGHMVASGPNLNINHHYDIDTGLKDFAADFAQEEGHHYEDGMIEVPMVVAEGVQDDLSAFCARLKDPKLIYEVCAPKKRMGRPRKKANNLMKVCDSDLEFLTMHRMVNQGPHTVAEHIWGIGKELGVSNVGDDYTGDDEQKYVDVLEAMEIRDRKAIGRSGVGNN